MNLEPLWHAPQNQQSFQGIAFLHEEEIRVLKDQHKLPSTYPPFDGVPRLKKAAALFVKKFLNVNVFSENCVPTVGAMHGCLISMAIAGRRMKKSDTILFLDPGFPVNKLQTKFLGLKTESIDMYDYRGKKLLKKLKEKFFTGEIGGILWRKIIKNWMTRDKKQEIGRAHV